MPASTMARRTPSATVATISGRPMCSGRMTSLMATPTDSRGSAAGGASPGSAGTRAKTVAWGVRTPSVPPDHTIGTCSTSTLDRVPRSRSTPRKAWSARMRVKSLTPPLPSVLPMTAVTWSAVNALESMRSTRPDASDTLSSTTLWTVKGTRARLGVSSSAELVRQLAKGAAAVAEAVLLGVGHLRERAPVALDGHDDRVVAEPAAPPRLVGHAALGGHPHVHVDLCPTVLDVGQVEDRRAVDHADRHGRAQGGERLGADDALLDQAGQRVVQRQEAPTDRGGAGAAVGLEHVAVDDDLPLPQRHHVARGAQGPADQPLDLLRAARRLAVLHLAADALGRRPRQHRVLGGDPALAPAPHPPGDVVVDRRRAQHPGGAEGHEARACGHLCEVTLEGDRAQLVGGTTVRSHRRHGNSPV